MTKAQARREAAAAARAALFGGDEDVPPRIPTAETAQAAPPSAQPVRQRKDARSEVSTGASSKAPIARADAPPTSTLANLLPRKWEGAPPQEGDLVFFRGGRWWVEPPVPLSFQESVWFRIGDHRVPKPVIDEATGIRVHRPLNENRTSFYVHVDELSPVPVSHRNPGLASRLPTVAGVARAERAKAGIRDVGDEIATLLRRCDSLEKVYECAAEYLGVTAPDLHGKYGHLNPGQQRMNLGNRMRAKWRKEHG